MLQRQNAAVFLGAFIDACALWRLYYPHLNLPGATFFYFVKPDWNLIMGNEVAVVQRCCLPVHFEFIATCRKMGMKVVYDLDDNIWDLPEYNPAHATLMRLGDGFRACIRAVDIVTVSTRHLAKEVRKHVSEMRNMHTGKQIPLVVCENWIDERMFADPIAATAGIKVGWQGSSSHIGDLLLIEKAVQHLAAEHKDVMFEFRGADPPPSLRLLPNVTHRMWMPVAEYAQRMPTWQWSIALAPVTDHPFNSSKSPIKMMEAAYCGIPCLASWAEPYVEFCSHDSDLKWLLCAGPSAWEVKLRALINEPAMCTHYGEKMRTVMQEHYSFRSTHPGWQQVMEMARCI